MECSDPPYSAPKEVSKELRCSYCDKVFSRPFNRKNHERKVHIKPLAENNVATSNDLEQEPISSAIKCDKCTSSFRTLEYYREHRRSFHGIPIKEVKHKFTSKADFEAWKGRLENATGVNYVAHRAAKRTSSGSKQVYYCKRSGMQRTSKNKKNNRCSKSQGTCKIGQYCTSVITVLEDQEVIEVTHYSDHSNHDLQPPSLAHMTLPKSTRESIAVGDVYSIYYCCDLKKMYSGMMVQGLPYEKILDRMRAISGTTRTSLLDKQDLVNIAKEFGLNNTQALHTDDSISVRLYVEKLKESGELLYFKDQGDRDQDHPQVLEKDFVFAFMKTGQRQYLANQIQNSENIKVCMDSTHCISQYKGYQLTTLMTISDLNEGFPVGFVISSSVNTDIIKIFLNAVKERIGTIKASVFMSDDDAVFRNAWRASMDVETTANTLFLNCTWHTDRTIRKAIHSKISASTVEKAEVYKIFRTLMDEPNVEKFNELCEGFLIYLAVSNFTDFSDYFKHNYLAESRKMLWPKCYRPDIDLNTNNHLECMHKVLKYIYLNGKKTKRLDSTLFALEKMVTDKLFSRLISLIKCRNVRKCVPHFNERHRQGMDLHVFQEEQSKYVVESASCMNKQYEVMRNTLTCTSCRERCPECEVCKCMYSCTCEDNEGKRNICKHIHAVVQYCKANTKVDIEKPQDPVQEIEMIQANVCGDAVDSDTLLKTRMQEIDALLLMIRSKCSSNKLDLQAANSLKTSLTQANAILDAACKYQTSADPLPKDPTTVNEPGNKNTVKQDRLYSVKKNKKTTDDNSVFKKPSSTARQEISDCLIKSDETSVSIPQFSGGSVEFEHNYGY